MTMIFWISGRPFGASRADFGGNFVSLFLIALPYRVQHGNVTQKTSACRAKPAAPEIVFRGSAPHAEDFPHDVRTCCRTEVLIHGPGGVRFRGGASGSEGLDSQAKKSHIEPQDFLSVSFLSTRNTS